MRFGIRFIQYVGNSHDLVRLSVAAEEAGFDSVWFPHDPYMRNTWVLTSAVACQTSKIEFERWQDLLRFCHFISAINGVPWNTQHYVHQS